MIVSKVSTLGVPATLLRRRRKHRLAKRIHSGEHRQASLKKDENSAGGAAGGTGVKVGDMREELTARRGQRSTRSHSARRCVVSFYRDNQGCSGGKRRCRAPRCDDVVGRSKPRALGCHIIVIGNHQGFWTRAESPSSKRQLPVRVWAWAKPLGGFQIPDPRRPLNK